VFLIAPRGTVDAGDAGIRVSGDLFVAALHVANANNIQVQGTTVGVPQQAAVNIGALTNASNAAGAAAAAATDTARTNRSPNTDLPSIITVEVIGYGGGDGTQSPDLREEKRRRTRDQQSYNPNSAFEVLGAGNLNDEQKKDLTEDEKRKLAQQ
jgi:hypothetical protein